MDGGFSDNIPHAKDLDDVITVSPYPGDFDICPEEDRHHNMKHFFHVANMELQFNMHNWWRIKKSLISPSMSELRDIQREGYMDTLRFLKTRGVCVCSNTCMYWHTLVHKDRHIHTHTYMHTYKHVNKHLSCVSVSLITKSTCRCVRGKVQMYKFVHCLDAPNWSQQTNRTCYNMQY